MHKEVCVFLLDIMTLPRSFFAYGDEIGGGLEDTSLSSCALYTLVDPLEQLHAYSITQSRLVYKNAN